MRDHTGGIIASPVVAQAVLPATDSTALPAWRSPGSCVWHGSGTASSPGAVPRARTSVPVAEPGVRMVLEIDTSRCRVVVAALTDTELVEMRLLKVVLAAGKRGAVARHQTLRATIDWSVQLLPGPEQALLARLAVFAGGATLEAAETVCSGDGIGPDAVLELLAALVARSLVVAEEHGPESRYRLLETIRQYGEQRLDQAGEAQRWRARHASYYAGLLSRVRDHAHDPTRKCFGRSGSAPSRTTCSQRGRGRSAPATPTPRLKSWPASRPSRSGSLTVCYWSAKRPWTCPAPPITRATHSPSRSVHSPRRCAAMWLAPRNYAAGRPTPMRAGIPRTGGSRRPSAPPARTSRTLLARSPTPPASPNRPPVWRGPAATPPTPPSSSLSPRAITSSPVTRLERSRWRTKRSHWPARLEPRPWSRPACSPWARASPRPPPNRPVPACAKAAS